MNLAHVGRKGLTTSEVPPTSPGAGVNGTGVDMMGWDRVVFDCLIGIIGNGGTFDMRVVESANANFSGAVNITGAAITQVPNTQANIVVSIDVGRLTNRYVRVVATPATNNANIAISATRYRGAGVLPASLPTNHQYVAVAAN